MSTAQIHSHIGMALALSTCVHAAAVVTTSWKFSARNLQSTARVLQITLSAPGEDGIHPPLEKGVGGFPAKQTQKNPPAPFSKGGEEAAFSSARQSGEGASASAGSGAGPTPRKIIKPEYTPRALRLGIQGEAVLGVTIGVDGRVVSARVVKGLGYGLDEAALDAILNSTFFPAQNAEGVGVEEQIIYRFRFELTV